MSWARRAAPSPRRRRRASSPASARIASAQGGRGAGRHQAPALAVGHDLGDGADGRGHDRQPGGRRLQRSQAEALAEVGCRGEDEHVAGVHERPDVVDEAQEPVGSRGEDGCRPPLEVRPQRAVARHQQAQPGISSGGAGHGVDEVGVALLRDEPGRDADDHVVGTQLQPGPFPRPIPVRVAPPADVHPVVDDPHPVGRGQPPFHQVAAEVLGDGDGEPGRPAGQSGWPPGTAGGRRTDGTRGTTTPPPPSTGGRPPVRGCHRG